MKTNLHDQKIIKIDLSRFNKQIGSSILYDEINDPLLPVSKIREAVNVSQVKDSESKTYYSITTVDNTIYHHINSKCITINSQYIVIKENENEEILIPISQVKLMRRTKIYD